MATDSNRESNESLYQQIQQLEKEKEELERKNKERQLLEQKLRELHGEVSSLRSGDSPIASTPQRASSARSPVISSPSRGHHDDRTAGGEQDLDSALQESRDSIHRLFTSQTKTPLPRATNGQQTNSSNKDGTSDSSSDSEKGINIIIITFKIIQWTLLVFLLFC